jgi:hypothetical protein
VPKMSNTWDSRFSFYVKGREDVPVEFQGAYDRLIDPYGPPAFGLFSPAMEDSGLIVSRWLPPWLIMSFSDAFALLSLDTKSDQVRSLIIGRHDFLGYGLAEFLLKCWFTLHVGCSPEARTEVRFPSRTSEYYWELSRSLLNWCGAESACIGTASQPIIELPGLPAKFASFLETHSEVGDVSEFFFQPAIDSRSKRQESFANLLLLMTPNGIVALGDQYRRERSELGIAMTWLHLRRVRLAEWVERTDSNSATLRISLQGTGSHSEVSWPVFSGLRPYALRWIDAVNHKVEPTWRQTALRHVFTNRDTGAGGSQRGLSLNADGRHVR